MLPELRLLGRPLLLSNCQVHITSHIKLLGARTFIRVEVKAHEAVLAHTSIIVLDLCANSQHLFTIPELELCLIGLCGTLTKLKYLDGILKSFVSMHQDDSQGTNSGRVCVDENFIKLGVVADVIKEFERDACSFFLVACATNEIHPTRQAPSDHSIKPLNVLLHAKLLDQDVFFLVRHTRHSSGKL